MATAPRPPERAALRLLAPLDAACNRLYGWRGNPLYHSGAIAVALLLVLIVTGVWLLFFYRVGAPYDSVARLTADPWLGRWIRGVHRYASDAVVVAVAVHAFRMYAQGRSWGPRALAWTTGVGLVALLYVCGLTGYVMVWDAFGRELAREGARMLDALPILSEPIGRAFTGEDVELAPFFFLNLFAHIAIPLGLGLVLWLHVGHVSRPVLLPPRGLAVALVAALVGVAVLRPIGMQPEANAFRLPAAVEMDLLYAVWLPLVRPLAPGVALGALVAAGAALLLVPRLTRRRGEQAPPPSVVNEDLCTGCRQCALDCPFDAITMIAREPGGRSLEVARVDPALCVSCGICAGSCAPMAVGPAGRTGREQLAHARRLAAAEQVADGQHVVVCCERGARTWGDDLAALGALVHPVDCAGSMHSSVVEHFVRTGAAGVLVVGCPPRDCWNREGAQWLIARLYHDREAELKARVDRRRVRVAHAGAGERREAAAALERFMAETPPPVRAATGALAALEDECASTAGSAS